MKSLNAIVFTLLFLLLLPVVAKATDVQITATLPTERVNGSTLALTDIEKINLYANYCDGQALYAITPDHFADGKMTFIDTTEKPVEDCAVTYQLSTVDTLGNESEKTAPVSPKAQPNPPTLIRIIIQTTRTINLQ